MTGINYEELSKLVVRLQQGDGKAFEEIYNMTYRTVRFTALKILNGNDEDADDVMQDCYVKVLEKINSLDKPESFMSWFNMMVANRSREIIRKKNPEFYKKLTSGKKDVDDDFSEEYKKEFGGEEYERTIAGSYAADNMNAVAEENDDYIPGEGGKEKYVEGTVAETDSDILPGVDIEQDELRKTVMGMIENLSDEKRTAVVLYYYNNMTTKQIAEAMDVSENTIKSRLVQAKKDLAKVVTEFEKKNGKLLGIAPMPLVRWALNTDSMDFGGKDMPDFSSFFAGIRLPNLHSAASAFDKIGFQFSEFFSNIANRISALFDGGVDPKPIAAAAVVTVGVVGGVITGTTVRNRNEKAKTETTTAIVTETETVTEETKPTMTVAPGKLVDTEFESGELKYGVSYRSRNYANKKGDEIEVREGQKTLNRAEFKASYSDLLPAAKENADKYSSQISSLSGKVNEYRTGKELSSLKTNSVQSEQANVRAEEIAWSAKNFDTRPDGSSYISVFEKNGYSSGSRYECRAYGCKTADAAMKKIAEKYGNELKDKNLTDIGVGAAENPETGELVFVVHLYGTDGKGTNGKPSIEEKAKEEAVDKLQEAIDKLQKKQDELLEKDENLDDDSILKYDFHNDRIFEGIEEAVDKMKRYNN